MFRALRRSLPAGVLGLVAVPCAVLTSACSESTHGAIINSSFTSAQPGFRAAATDTGLAPALIAGEPTCADVSGGAAEWLEARLDSGEWLAPGTCATYFEIQPNPDMTRFLNWTAGSAIIVKAVLVNGGSAAHLYDYEAVPRTLRSRDTQLHSPVKASGRPTEISHITFCYTLATSTTED